MASQPTAVGEIGGTFYSTTKTDDPKFWSF